MSEMKVIPNVLIHKFLTGNTLTGVSPVGAPYSFKYKEKEATDFQAGETLSWTGGTGRLLAIIAGGASAGTIFFTLLTGVAPTIDLVITGGTSSAVCAVDGIAAINADTGELIERGRTRMFLDLTAGGLVELPSEIGIEGFKVVTVSISMPGLTAVDFIIEDMFGGTYSADSVTLSTGLGYFEWRNGGIIVAPGFKFKAVGTGTLSGGGQIMFTLGKGWGQSTFSQLDGLGATEFPPAMRRT